MENLVIRVLVAAAEPLLALGMRTVLERADDIRICGEACSRPELYALAAATLPDVVIYDVAFPREDEQFLERLLASAPDCKPMVLVDHTEAECPLRGAVAGQSFQLSAAALEHSGECCLLALRQAARGCFPRTAAPEQLIHSVRQIAAGELAVGAWATAHLLASRPFNTAPKISGREVQIIELVASGLSNKQIAARLSIREPTVKNHLGRISRKLHVRSRTDLARFALQQGIVRPV